MSSINSLEDVVISFCSRHGGITQHTKEWENIMASTIGGSDISSALGQNKYRDFDKLIQDKFDLARGIKPNMLQFDLMWGTLFEGMIKQYVEMSLNCNIHGDKICITDHVGLRCSPDGYAVVKYDEDHGILTHLDNHEIYDADDYIVMFEFKCPAKRYPKKGIIPDCYISQVLLGLSLSPIVSFGIFVDALFRRCNWNHFDYNTKHVENVDYKYGYGKPHAYDLPIAYSICGVYVPDVFNKFTKNDLIPYFINDNIINGNVIDIGSVGDQMFLAILKYITTSAMLIHRCEILMIPDKNILYEEVISSVPDGYVLFGILPWKLYSVDYVYQSYQDGFLDIAKSKALEVNRLVTDRLRDPHYISPALQKLMDSME
jgi:hypothetical protein